GEHSLLGRGALVGHHVALSDGVVINPGANVGGNVRLGRGATIGMGATVVNGVSIGERALVAAGAVVIRDVPPAARVQGVPARIDRIGRLVERAIPSALAQTYANVEVVVVGDAAGSETRTAIESLGDDRIRSSDLTHRVVHPDPHRHWLTGAIMPRNEAHRLAQGRWIADLDDDDALRPDAVEHLLEFARSERAEVAYGIVEMIEPDGRRSTIGGFPPAPLEPDWRERGLGWQPWRGSASTGAIFHTGLRLFGREHVAAVLGIPGDFFRLERMVRAGVRFGMLERITYDYYPSSLWDAPPPE